MVYGKSMRTTKQMSSKDKTLLSRASELASHSTENYRHGAIIVKGSKTLAVGINRNVNNPNQVSNPKTEASIHAEVAALNACRRANLEGAVIYVARILKDGSPAMSRPCGNCQKALREAGIKKVFYTVDSELEL